MTEMTMPADTTTAPPRRAHLARYALWQARDYAVERGLPTWILAALFVFPGAMAGRRMIHELAAGHVTVRPSAVMRYGSLAAAQHAQVHEFTLGFIRGIAGIIVFLAALLAVQGLASNDRKHGYYRFLFAKPVAPGRYYGQAFLVHWAAFLAALALFFLVFGWLVVPVISANLFVAMALVYLCYAGIAFLLTATTKWDWILMVAVSLASTTLWTRFGDSTSPLAKLLWLLPPLTKTDAVYAAAASPHPVEMPWGTIAWLAGYGLVCFIAGLAVLHRRRLATP